MKRVLVVFLLGVFVVSMFSAITWGAAGYGIGPC